VDQAIRLQFGRTEASMGVTIVHDLILPLTWSGAHEPTLSPGPPALEGVPGSAAARSPPIRRDLDALLEETLRPLVTVFDANSSTWRSLRCPSHPRLERSGPGRPDSPPLLYPKRITR
jgi:hypothetical protein